MLLSQLALCGFSYEWQMLRDGWSNTVINGLNSEKILLMMCVGYMLPALVFLSSWAHRTLGIGSIVIVEDLGIATKLIH